MIRRFLPSFVGLLIVICVLPIVLGWDRILLASLPGELPLGTLMAAVALVAASGLTLLKSEPVNFRRFISIVLLVAAIGWLPLGIILSGNASLGFVNDAADSDFFWRFTEGLIISIIVTWIWAVIAYLLKKRAE